MRGKFSNPPEPAKFNINMEGSKDLRPICTSLGN